MSCDDTSLRPVPSEGAPAHTGGLSSDPATPGCADSGADARDDTCADDSFELFDLKVEVVAGDRPFVCSHHVGDYFLVQGENLVFPQSTSFSMYALAAILPMLPAKQRPLHPNDWMLSDAEIACPDPNCGARFRITRVARRTQSHAACTVVPLADAR